MNISPIADGPFSFKTTLSALYSDNNQFGVPNYQRAYSWEVGEQVTQFIRDIKEHPHGIKQYHFGHFLFERDIAAKNRFWIIDGQQRMTTFFIFICALRRELLKDKNHLTTVKSIEDCYLKTSSVGQRLETVDYDNEYFRNVLIDNIKDLPETRSRIRILEAYKFFIAIIQKEGVLTALGWKILLENAKITTDVVEDKSEAVQIFAFQNDRGKHLSTLEKLKAFLMLQVYTNEYISNRKAIIRAVENQFEDIYRTLEKFDLIDEDQLLNFHTIAFLSVGETSLERVKSKLSKTKKEDQEIWIRQFVANLKSSFFYVVEIEKKLHQDTFLGDVICLDIPNSFSLILKLYHYNHDDVRLEKVYRLISIILFRLKFTLGKYYSNYLPQAANEYGGDMQKLLEYLFNIAKVGFKSYWSFEADFHRCLEGDYHYWPVTKYLLWQYENMLRSDVKDNKISYSEFADFYGSNLRMETTIDHWLPRNPEENNYDPELVQKYINNIGNLVLSTRARNSSDSNSPPAQRDTESPLISRQRLEKDKAHWGKEHIKQRQNEIVEFAKKHWNPISVTLN